MQHLAPRGIWLALAAGRYSLVIADVAGRMCPRSGAKTLGAGCVADAMGQTLSGARAPHKPWSGCTYQPARRVTGPAPTSPGAGQCIGWAANELVRDDLLGRLAPSFALTLLAGAPPLDGLVAWASAIYSFAFGHRH